jgi:DNA repair protein RadC
MATQSIPAFRENSGTYIALRELTSVDIIGMAKNLLAEQFQRDTEISSPSDSRDYLISQLADLEHEVFAVLFLDNRHRVISFDHLFNGTIDGASVHPREVVKRALKHNAAAVILTHNHPSGVPEPSQADQSLTRRLKDALALVDVRVLDHIVVGGVETVSFAERGLI